MFRYQNSALTSLHNGSVPAFFRREDGGLIIFSLFMIVCMLLAVGVGVDTMRYEVQRTKIQNTADRAVLAAADLTQTLNPQDVVNDYFLRAGLDPSKVDVTVTPGVGGRTVTAATPVVVPTYLLKLIGVPKLEGPAIGAAQQSVTDIEVVLVLDNSGSMSWDNKLNLLKAAAKQFVDDVVQDDTGQGTVAISIVPFATQVNAGAELTGFYNVSDEHGYSHCVDFAASDFETTAMTSSDPLQRGGHFDPWTYNTPIRNSRVVCPWDDSRAITTWSRNRTTLKTQIDAMWAGGNTSIDVASKWGASLLDPTARPLLDAKIGDGSADGELAGMPFDYDRPSTKKYLVVMTDGQNTTQYRLRPEYRSGNSPVFKDPLTGKLSYFVEATGRYYDVSRRAMQALPVGGDSAVNLTWPELFNAMAVREFARYVKQPAVGGRWQDYYNEIVTGTGENTKNARTSRICGAARTNGVTVFTIGVDTYGQGDATLLDCAGDSSYFFDITPEELDEAFSAIARQIKQLRLTQ